MFVEIATVPVDYFRWRECISFRKKFEITVCPLRRVDIERTAQDTFVTAEHEIRFGLLARRLAAVLIKETNAFSSVK